jgi:hypothetical protein
MKRTILLTALALCLFGCSVEPSKLSEKHAEKMATKLTYFKDEKTGLCFATIASRRMFDPDQSGLGLTCVPCSALRKETGK